MKNFILLFFSLSFFAQDIPLNIKKLMQVYPNFIVGYTNNSIVFKDKSTMIYNDGIKKSNQELLNNPDIEDQFFYLYVATEDSIKTDAGRIRNETFFRKMYGSTQKEVQNNLTEIVWCPKLVNKKIKVTKINGLNKIVENLSRELDQNSDLTKYISNIAGTFNWRKISGTNRLSTHSFGITIDINVKFSNYWQWDCKCDNELQKLGYKNRIPKKLVAIFEKYGFIWGGNWRHYDTMHFEYRPELL